MMLFQIQLTQFELNMTLLSFKQRRLPLKVTRFEERQTRSLMKHRHFAKQQSLPQLKQPLS